jgi:hydrogenase nickel incorporation protein HypB
MCVTCGCGTSARHDDDAAMRADAARTIRLEAEVLGANDRVAARNRAHFAAHGVTALNLVSSPGSGKTTLLVETIGRLRRRAPGLAIAVIEGDQQTSNDAERIRATGVPAVQVNTGKGCHLDATMVERAFARLPIHAAAHGDGLGPSHEHREAHEHADEHERGGGHEHRAEPDSGAAHPPGGALLFIENVGNLVCPAAWNLGEAAKVVVLSVTEGDDKPAKYPDMFAAASLMVVNKVDLLPYVDFDLERCVELARRANPRIAVLRVSARTGDGLDAWVEWLLDPSRAPEPDAATGSADAHDPVATEAALRRRIAELEARLAAAGGGG